MNYNAKYYDNRYMDLARELPLGGDMRYDLRQYGYNIVKKNIKEGSSVFDYGCGLGLISIQLAKEKQCKVAGNDISMVAIDYINSQIPKGDFRVADDIFLSKILAKKTKYDCIILYNILPTIKTPLLLCEYLLTKGKKLIVSIPNNFRAAGENIQIKWKSFKDFEEIFRDYDIRRVDKYPEDLKEAYKAPIYIIKKLRRKEYESNNYELF